MNLSPIASVDTLVLRGDTSLGALDSAQETVVVRLTDEAGRVGIGEADSNEEAVRAVVHRAGGHAWSAGLEPVLLGADPVTIASLNAMLTTATFWAGPGGIAAHAVSAIDVALHDLAGKQLSRPAFHLIGGARRDRLRPYATCWVDNPTGALTLPTMMERTLALMTDAVARGFTAVKMEVLFGVLVTDRELATCIHEGRQAIGPDVELLVDFGYRWSDWRDAARVLDKVADDELWLAEAPLVADDLLGYARLVERSSARIGGGEAASTLAECRAWLDVARVDVLQPDVARAGGLTGLRRIAELAELSGVSVVPHCWRTGINAAAARHLSAACVNVPMIEFLPAGFSPSPLRESLVTPEPALVDGCFALPTRPGLGVELHDDVVARHLT